MKICRFKNGSNEVRIGLIADDATLLDLTPAGITELQPLLESDDPVAQLEQVVTRNLPRVALSGLKLCAPVEQQEVWAAGVTYLRSKKPRAWRNPISAPAPTTGFTTRSGRSFSSNRCRRKSCPPGNRSAFGSDARWNVPEPELALVLNSRGQHRRPHHRQRHEFARHRRRKPALPAAGQDLPPLLRARSLDHRGHARSRRRATGPSVSKSGGTDSQCFRAKPPSARSSAASRNWPGYLFRCQVFPHGAVLLTGTGIVPPETFTLAEQDEIVIAISGIGRCRTRWWWFEK